MGDRSILLGLLQIFSNTYGKSKIFLGSINTFFSERCLFEDEDFRKLLAPDVTIHLYDSKDKRTLKRIIEKSDIVVFGGGPIMDIDGLRMIKFAFQYAKKRNKRNAILGCGVGPIFKESSKKLALEIFKLSDLSILRDPLSVQTINEISKTFEYEIVTPISYLHDPAIIPVGTFLRDNNKINKNKNLIINLRDFPAAIFRKTKKNDLDYSFAEFVKSLSSSFEQILLLPNHTFFHGGDDREYLSKIKHLSNNPNVKVQQKPLGLYSLFSNIYSASACVGMRYHAIMFQTFLNGRNAIIDYTLPDNGKIHSFLVSINGVEHYNKWYLNMHDDIFNLAEFSSNIKNISEKTIFKFENVIFQNTINNYSMALDSIT